MFNETCFNDDIADLCLVLSIVNFNGVEVITKACPWKNLHETAGSYCELSL